jgi:hypothetical protein
MERRGTRGKADFWQPPQQAAGLRLGGFSATNFRDLSKGVTAPQKDRDLLRAYLQRRPAVKRREEPGGFFA